MKFVFSRLLLAATLIAASAFMTQSVSVAQTIEVPRLQERPSGIRDILKRLELDGFLVARERTTQAQAEAPEPETLSEFAEPSEPAMQLAETEGPGEFQAEDVTAELYNERGDGEPTQSAQTVDSLLAELQAPAGLLARSKSGLPVVPASDGGFHDDCPPGYGYCPNGRCCPYGTLCTRDGD
ncbi:MAG: hypothetical protein JJ979_18365, partial [Roseibium sp.]|nr:hypothetical protein [Roseibium sp.]